MRTLSSALILLFCSSTFAADWPQFRGPDRSGISTEDKAPINWSSTSSIKWKAALPQPGNSSPIVSGNRVFLTVAEDSRGRSRSLYCFDRESGKKLWSKSVTWEKPDPTHKTNPYAASTPAADGSHVYVWHGSPGFYCYDYEGNEIWRRDLGVYRHIWGYASSPVLYNDRILLNVGPGQRQALLALDKATGKTLWETPEPGGAEDKSAKTGKWIGSWATPVIAKINNQDQVLCAMPGKVNAYDPASGKVIWFVEGAGDLAYNDVILAGDIGVYMSGFHGPAIGFKLTGGSGNVTESNRLWRKTSRIPQRIGTGVVVNGHIYSPGETILQCIDPKTGDELWSNRPANQSFWAPALATAKGHIYFLSQRGITHIVEADPKGYKQITANGLGEPSNSSPALANGLLFIRTARHLYCIEEK